ncbi:hypothetical protein AX14_007492 [Amanita brunnescens Koide BX004]|nr:hypothetical protein AX14_007492 [Amanita brunnescens Koide BX004]
MCPAAANMMPTATLHMPLRTTQNAPCFSGAADDLPRYIAEIIKYMVYYTDDEFWDTWSAT